MITSTPPQGDAHHPPRTARPHPVPTVAEPVRALPRPGAEERFWADVRRLGTPLVGPDPLGDSGHRAVTFLWRGGANTRAVQVLPNKLGDPRDPARNLMAQQPGTNVWHWTLRLPVDWRGTYDLYVDDGDGPQRDAAGYWPWLRTRRHADPFNSRTLPRRWGGQPVPYLELPDAPRALECVPRTGVPRGEVHEHRVDSARLGRSRRVWLYRSAGAAPEAALPVLVLLDGEHWQPQLDVATMLDNLVADGRIAPLVAVLPESVDADTRWADLTCRPEYVAFLTDELLPWAADHTTLTGDPAHTVIAGQSLGGLTAAYAALCAPQRFGNALVQSGSMWWPNGPRAEWLTGRVSALPRQPVRLWMSFGTEEWVVLPAARRMRDALAAAGYHDVSYREFTGGHDYLCWRTELSDGLAALLPG